jgi:hypothetical protein
LSEIHTIHTLSSHNRLLKALRAKRSSVIHYRIGYNRIGNSTIPERPRRQRDDTSSGNPELLAAGQEHSP